MANERKLIIDSLKRYHDTKFTPGVYGHSIFGKAALILEKDAVEVVRCKDCKHWMDSWVAPDGKQEHGYCHMEEADDVVVGRWSDDFCSYGERRTDEI